MGVSSSPVHREDVGDQVGLKRPRRLGGPLGRWCRPRSVRSPSAREGDAVAFRRDHRRPRRVQAPADHPSADGGAVRAHPGPHHGPTAGARGPGVDQHRAVGGPGRCAGAHPVPGESPHLLGRCAGPSHRPRGRCRRSRRTPAGPVPGSTPRRRRRWAERRRNRWSGWSPRRTAGRSAAGTTPRSGWRCWSPPGSVRRPTSGAGSCRAHRPPAGRRASPRSRGRSAAGPRRPAYAGRPAARRRPWSVELGAPVGRHRLQVVQGHVLPPGRPGRWGRVRGLARADLHLRREQDRLPVRGPAGVDRLHPVRHASTSRRRVRSGEAITSDVRWSRSDITSRGRVVRGLVLMCRVLVA